MLKIIINGCNGKMGQVISSMISSNPDFTVIAGIDRYISKIPTPNSYPIFTSFQDCSIIPDVIIDFSRPDALHDVLDFAQKNKIGIIIATTGLTNDDIEIIQEYAKRIPIFMSANMSLGVNLMMDLVRKAASFLGDSFNIEIIEKHHNQKVDSPSGTALALANVINRILLNSKNYIFGRHSKSEKRSDHEIGIHSIRGGTIVGEHQVLFIGNDEILEIKHTAQSKLIFATGALCAAKYLASKTSGLYDMQDLLFEQSSVTNVYTDHEEAMVTINNIPHQPLLIAKIFNAIAENHINIDMISQTAPINDMIHISFTVPDQKINETLNILGIFNTMIPGLRIDIYGSITKLTVEGIGMERQSGIAARMFSILAEQNIKVKIITTSETKIAYIIDQYDEKQAVDAIVQSFGL